MKKPFILPEFKNADEERENLAKIAYSEYVVPSDIKKVSFPHIKRTKRLISIRVDEELIEKAKEKAAKLHIPYQTLMRQILYQGLERLETKEKDKEKTPYTTEK